MHVVARSPGQPGLDLGMLVRAVVVDDEVDIECLGHAGLDVAQEGEELLVPVARAALGQDCAGGDVEGGEQGGGAVAHIVMGDALGIAEPHRQQRLGALQRLDLRLLVHAQHHRMIGRVQVQADDVADFFDEERVGGQLEVALAVRLDAEQGEPALHGALGDAGVLGHGAHAPVRGAGRLGLQGGLDHFGHPLVLVHPRPAGPQFVVQALQAQFQAAPTPLADRRLSQAKALGDGAVGLTLGTGQHDLRALYNPVWNGTGAGQAEQLGFFFLIEDHRQSGSGHGGHPGVEHTHYYIVYLWDSTLARTEPLI